MNPLIQLKTTPPLLMALALLGFALLPKTQAVVPPPDGGYPGFNTAEGQSALFSLTTGSANTAVGWASLFSNTDGNFNTATGAGTLLFNTGGDENTAFGAAALLNNTVGGANTAIGFQALFNNTTGPDNTAIGFQALFSNTDGNFNTANGEFALFSNTGVSNTAIGKDALVNNTSGNVNTALGAFAGTNLTTGNNNIDIGNLGLAGESSTIRIGSESQTRTFIAAIRGVTTGIADAVSVVIDSNGQLGTMSSARRFKKETKPMDQASEAVLALKPVTFHYKSDKTNTPQFGLIAEEVAKVNPDLVVRDKKGEIYTVRYEAVNAMLLNEFLKEHCRVENLDATVGRLKSDRADQETAISDLKNEVHALTAQLKEQAAQIQKVSAQLAAASPFDGGLEASKFATGRIRGGGPAPQVVNNP
jgi:hypothetical protein